MRDRFVIALWLVFFIGASVFGRERVICVEQAGKPKCVEDSLALRAGLVSEHVSQIRVSPGQEFELTVVLNVKSSAVTNWAYGVAHDPSKLELIEVTTEGSDIGFKPDFDVTRSAGGTPAPGFVSGVVLDFNTTKFLPVEDDFVLARVKYKVIGYIDPTNASLVTFTDELGFQGSPRQAIVIGIGGVENRPSTVIDTEVSGDADAADCNSNRVDDRDDLRNGTSSDCNKNGVPDECDLHGGPIGFETAKAFLAGQEPNSLSLVDLNGDGIIDVATANGVGNDITVLQGKGGGSFLANASYRVGRNPTMILSSDFNGDRAMDLVVTNVESGSASVLLGNCDGTLQPAADLKPFSFPIAGVASDFDQDGTSDLVIVSREGPVYYLRGNGDGTFQEAVFTRLQSLTFSCAAGDFDGDGKADLVIPNLASDLIQVLLGKGDGTFQAPVTVRTGDEPRFVLAADVNGDGAVDIITANQASLDLSVLFGNGAGTRSRIAMA